MRLPDVPGKWLDAGIWIVGGLVVAIAAYLGWSVWSHSQVTQAGTPAARAVINLEQVVRANPNDAMARVRLAATLSLAGRTDEAVEQYSAALKIEKDMPQALRGLAMIAMQRKDFTAAEKYWQRILDNLAGAQYSTVDQRVEEAYYGLGVVALETKRNEDAVRYLKEALRMRKDASDSHYMLSVAYRELGLVDQQKSELQVTLAFDPNNAQASYDLGLVVQKEGDIAQAAELFRISADKAPRIELPRQALAAIEKQGTAEERIERARRLAVSDPALALVQARIAAALAPEDANAVRLVAELADKVKDKERALNAYRRLLELTPGDPAATKAIERLGGNAK